MNSDDYFQGLESEPVAAKIRALSLMYSSLTVYTRELFLPESASGGEKRVIEMLRGVNELHHTISNQLARYTNDGKDYFPIEVFSKALTEIADQYRIRRFLTATLDFVRTRNSPRTQ
jgi:hypothetical protein